VNEKKIRREIRGYKVLQHFCWVCMFGFLLLAYWVAKDTKPSPTTHILAFGFVILSASVGCVPFMALLLQRQAEYALYFKELITARDEARTEHSASGSALDKSA